MNTLIASATITMTAYELFNSNPVGYIYLHLISGGLGTILLLVVLALIDGWRNR